MFNKKDDIIFCVLVWICPRTSHLALGYSFSPFSSYLQLPYPLSLSKTPLLCLHSVELQRELLEHSCRTPASNTFRNSCTWSVWRKTISNFSNYRFFSSRVISLTEMTHWLRLACLGPWVKRAVCRGPKGGEAPEPPVQWQLVTTGTEDTL